jgi:hypothetical protein
MAFYWSHRDVFVVLTNDEEMQLVRELGPRDVIGYHIHRATRRKYEALISAHLKQTLADDPERFRVKYWYRSRYGLDAMDLFKVYMEAYGRFTRNAIPGRWRDADVAEDLGVTLRQAVNSRDEFVVTLIRYSWLRRAFTAIGEISFPVDSVQSIAGTPTNFVLVTDAAAVKFTPKFVRVSVTDNTAWRADLESDGPELNEHP